MLWPAHPRPWIVPRFQKVTVFCTFLEEGAGAELGDGVVLQAAHRLVGGRSPLGQAPVGGLVVEPAGQGQQDDAAGDAGNPEGDLQAVAVEEQEHHEDGKPGAEALEALEGFP